MKLALITDLHANREALEAIFDHARRAGVDRYAFLGDYVGYGADPAWVVDRVREHVAAGAVAVVGNHDLGVVDGPAPTMVPEARAAVLWTRAQLDADQIAFLKGLPYHATDGDLLFVHANAFAPRRWEYITGRTEAVRSLRATDRAITFCGHMHEPRLFHLAGNGASGEFIPTAEVNIPLTPHRRWLAIPGSAGQPRDGNPAACYASFDLEQLSLTFHRVPYDHEGTAAKIRDAGLPLRLATRLADGQ